LQERPERQLAGGRALQQAQHGDPPMENPARVSGRVLGERGELFLVRRARGRRGELRDLLAGAGWDRST
jgi:hypothetical protein